ncbi:Ulp1 family isopeptidase [Rickettsia endosymbiont of Ixodes pacificus]|uniref:Ulp1 family isopeptidase n=1 Tax=Rickettsia endosymbiont of Ixodes pacificus TaxID=1133329 RepID=UPI002F428B3E
MENIQESDYWYSEDDIKNILEANIDKNKFSIVTHVDLTSPEQVRDALREGVHEDLKNKGKVVLMPINTGHGHWVSMMISKDNDTNKIIFTYNDPLGRSLNDRPDLVKLITEVCSDAEIIDLKTQQQEEGNTSDCGVFVCDDLIRQSQGLKILSTEQCKGQGLNLRKSQAETLKQSLIAQQAQEQHYYINGDSASEEEEEENNNGNNEEVIPPLYGDNDEVEVGGAAM